MKHYIPVLFLFFTSCLQAGLLTESPQAICQWMKAERFSGASEYASFKENQYRCLTLRKSIAQGEPVASDVRYVAEGTANAISEVRLELRMRSFRQPQQALRKFHTYADILTKKALSVGLPEEASKSIRSGITGHWQLSGKIIELKKLHQAGGSYDFHFSIL